MDVAQAVEKARTHIGQEWGPLTLTIDPYWVRTFVEAIEDPNPLWLDDAFARQTPWGGTVVPPTALCSLMARFRMRLRPELDMQWGTETVNAGVHYALPNPIRPGDQISCRFRVADLFSKVGRTGPLIFAVREQSLTNQRGEEVLVGRQITAHYEGTGLAERRPIPSPQRPSRAAGGAEGIWLDTVATGLRPDIGPGPSFDDVHVGQELPEASRGPIRTRDQVKWAASTEDWDEIHYDYIYSRQVGLPDVISNGNFGYCATAGRMLTDWLGTTGVLTAFSTSYRAATYIGDTLTASGEITAASDRDRTVEIQVTVRNQIGESAVLGVATARLR